MKANEAQMEMVRRYLSGDATQEDTRSLGALLLGDAQVRRDFLAYARVDAALSAAARPQLQVAGVAAPRQQFRWKRWLPLAAAAVLMAMMGLAAWRGAAVALMGATRGAQWVSAAAEFSAGDALSRGQRLELAGGSAEIVFACGAVTTLHGPCIFEIESAKSARLVLGHARTLAATPESKGFTLRTRTARIVDLGTEFETTAAADGRSRVEVTQGRVVVHSDGANSPQHLAKGDALSLEPGRARVMVRIERGDGTPAFHFPSIEPPSDRDYADARQDHAKITVAHGILGNLNSHIASGPAEVLLDGRGQSAQDAPRESVYFERNSDGRLLLDLGRPVQITKVNTYSWHQGGAQPEHRYRAQQSYVLYGFAGDVPPSAADDPEATGWTLIARVNTDEFFGVKDRLDRPPQQGCSIASPNGALGRYRHLLWHVLPMLEPERDITVHTLYGEIDVYAQP
ncbi:MAG: FecR domain-containing protein [Prosthecobacter sp.]|uniref:FecR domain-containing protein n=1 Tax=Prosthecobacter sp. TaxID=1965333 RepID=UPI0038FE41D9